MRYGEMKTSFHSSMEALKIDATLFDFAENIDAASYFIATNLPSEAIPELMGIYTVDISVNQTDNRGVPLPSDYLLIESATLAKERSVVSVGPPIVYGAPLYLPATIVSQREYLLKTQFSSEPVVSMFNGLLNYNPDLPEELASYPGPIRMVYRRKPNTFTRNYANSGTGASVASLTQEVGQPRVLNLSDVADNWIDYGIDVNNMFGGKMICPIDSKIYIYDIDYAWDGDRSTTLSGLHIKESSIIVPLGAPIPVSFVQERPDVYTGITSVYLSDTEEPEINSVYHQLMLDYAKARFLFTRQPEVAQALMQMVIQTFQSLGVTIKIEFGGEGE
jgi:hypothetical protein